MPAPLYSITQRGNFLLIGNTLVQDVALNVPRPILGTIDPGVTNSNLGGPDVYWAVNGASPIATKSTTPTQAKSGAQLTIPAGAVVTKAILFWSALNPQPDRVVTVDRPGSFRTDVTAAAVATGNFGRGTDAAYMAWADVTALVQARGSGAYQISDVSSQDVRSASSDVTYAGWSMYVVYESASEERRQFSLFNPFAVISASSYTEQVTGFVAAGTPSGATLGITAFEGDAGLVDDRLAVNGTAVSDALNPADNIFNATRSYLGNPGTQRGDLPQLTGTMNSMGGIDLDVFDVGGLVSPGDTTVSIAATTTGDVVAIGAIMLAVVTANAAPVGTADAYGTTEDSALVVPAAGVLANDRDGDGDALTAILGTGPAHGALALDPAGGFTYTPAADYSGTDGFTYVASDGVASSAPVTVTLTVAPVNDSPVAGNDGGFTAGYETVLVLAQSALLANDTDTENDPLTVAAVQGASHGTVALRGSDVIFTPDAGYSGAASFTYTITDGQGGSSGAIVSLTVAGPPAGSGNYTYGTAGDDIYDKSGSTTSWLINGAGGDDVLRGGSANDSLNGGAGDDRISGGAGNDVITGGAGADRMQGGLGDDTFLFRPGDLVSRSYPDHIIDFEGAGRPGGDVIRLVGFGSAATLTLVEPAVPGQFIYHYHVEDGASSGDILIQTGGVLLTNDDYGFFAA